MRWARMGIGRVEGRDRKVVESERLGIVDRMGRGRKRSCDWCCWGCGAVPCVIKVMWRLWLNCAA